MQIYLRNEYKRTKSPTSPFQDHEPSISPKQLYELEVPLSSYLVYWSTERIHLSILAKCFTCSIEKNNDCHICKGDLYYETTRIYTVPIFQKKVFFVEGGNFLPDYNKPCDLIIKCKDKYDKFYKRIGINHLYTYVYWDGHDMIFKYIDNTYYKLDIYKKYNSIQHKTEYEPCDFSNNIFRIDNMGLLNLPPRYTPDIGNTRGDLFIRLTQDKEYELDENTLNEALAFLEYHPENIIEPNEILKMDVILGHFT